MKYSLKKQISLFFIVFIGGSQLFAQDDVSNDISELISQTISASYTISPSFPHLRVVLSDLLRSIDRDVEERPVKFDQIFMVLTPLTRAVLLDLMDEDVFKERPMNFHQIFMLLGSLCPIYSFPVELFEIFEPILQESSQFEEIVINIEFGGNGSERESFVLSQEEVHFLREIIRCSEEEAEIEERNDYIDFNA